MASGADKERADSLEEGAQGDIRAEQLLGKRETFAGEWQSDVYDPPFITYFQSEEQPHFLFSNSSRGVTINGDRVVPDNTGSHRLTGKRRSAMCITDRGIHFTVGRSGSDFHEFVPFSLLQSVEARSGVRMNKFIFSTSDGSEYRFATEPQPGSALKAPEEYINKRINENDENDHLSEYSNSETISSGQVTLELLQGLDEYDFENLVSLLWEKQGWQTQVTKGAGDRGVDVIARKETPFEQHQLIQAKRYSHKNKVGSEEIQKYSGLYARRDQVDAVVVVTTSGFTKEARSVAQNRNVKLVDGQKLLSLIREYDIDV